MAQADAYPARPIRVIVPFAAGGPADVIAREMAQSLGKDLGQSMVVENMGGGAGVPALNTVAFHWHEKWWAHKHRPAPVLHG